MSAKAYDPRYNYIPRDYEDLYLYYIVGDGFGNSLCHQIIRSILKHSTDDERETLAHDVFLRIMDKDMLRVFDPEKANFGGVIFFVTRTVCVNHLSRKGRNPLTGLHGGSLVETDPETGVFEPGTYSLDRLKPLPMTSMEDTMGDRQLVGEIVKWAIELRAMDRHIRDRSIMPMLQMMQDGYEPKDIGPALGVSPSTIHNWQRIVKDKAQEIRDRLESN